MEISDLRKEIDSIDDKLLELFLRRMSVSEEIAEYKKSCGMPVLDKKRERAVLAEIQKKAGDCEEYAYCLFSKIMELSRAKQNEMISAKSAVIEKLRQTLSEDTKTFPKSGSVACQGVEGGNAQVACDKLIPRGNILYVRSFRAVFDAVESGLCRFGIVPIENSINGSVRAVYDLLLEKHLFIVRSAKLCIRHELLAKPQSDISGIKTIYSHQQAIEQCSKFLAGYPSIKVIQCENTATAAKLVAESPDLSIAAISGPQCETLYDLKPLATGISDSDNNYTRFICIAREPVIYTGANKISLIVACDNRPGALGDILAKLSARSINMSKLESCSVAGRNFEFIFILELDASLHEAGVLPLLADLEQSCPSFTFLGSYDMV